MLISAHDLESLEATVELLSDPQASARLAEAEADVAAGRISTAEEMVSIMAERRQRELPSA